MRATAGLQEACDAGAKPRGGGGAGPGARARRRRGEGARLVAGPDAPVLRRGRACARDAACPISTG